MPIEHEIIRVRLSGNPPAPELDDAFKSELFSHRGGVTFKCGKCKSAFNVDARDIDVYRVGDRHSHHVLKTTCVVCGEPLTVLVNSEADFI